MRNEKRGGVLSGKNQSEQFLFFFSFFPLGSKLEASVASVTSESGTVIGS